MSGTTTYANPDLIARAQAMIPHWRVIDVLPGALWQAIRRERTPVEIRRVKHFALIEEWPPDVSERRLVPLLEDDAGEFSADAFMRSVLLSTYAADELEVEAEIFDLLRDLRQSLFDRQRGSQTSVSRGRPREPRRHTPRVR